MDDAISRQGIFSANEIVSLSSNPAFGSSKVQYIIDSSGRRHSAFVVAVLDAKLASSRKGKLSICTSTHVSAGREIISSSGPLGDPHILLLRQEFFLSFSSAFVIIFTQFPLLVVLGLETTLIVLVYRFQDIFPMLVPTSYVSFTPQDRITLKLDAIIQQNHFTSAFRLCEKRPLIFIREFVQYMLQGTGPLLSPILELLIHIRESRSSR